MECPSTEGGRDECFVRTTPAVSATDISERA